MKMTVFSPPCSLVQVYWLFRGACCLHYQCDEFTHLWNDGKLVPDYTVQQPRRQPSSLDLLATQFIAIRSVVFLLLICSVISRFTRKQRWMKSVKPQTVILFFILVSLTTYKVRNKTIILVTRMWDVRLLTSGMGRRNIVQCVLFNDPVSSSGWKVSKDRMINDEGNCRSQF
jgi:hypothetical protein